MEIIVLDARMFTDESSFHEYLLKRMELPEYYGKNLDALHDCLTDRGDCIITINNAGKLAEMGEYGREILKVFKAASQENDNMILVVNE